MSKTTVQPIGTRLLVRPLDPQTKTASGLFLPETAREKPQTGQVIAVGDDESIKVKPMDRILFAKYNGTEFKLDGEDYLILEASEVLARLN